MLVLTQLDIRKYNDLPVCLLSFGMHVYHRGSEFLNAFLQVFFAVSVAQLLDNSSFCVFVECG